MIKLLIKTLEETQEVTLGDEPATLGRHPQNRIVLKDRKSSRYHAKIEKIENQYRLADLESNNGTRVNQEQVLVRVLRKGDVIALGESVVTVLDLDTPVPVASPESAATVPAAPVPVAEAPAAKPAFVDDATVMDPPPPPVEMAPVPIEKKMEVKKRIEDARAVAVQEETRSDTAIVKLLAKIGAAAAVLVVAIVLLIQASNRSTDPRPEQLNRARLEKERKLKEERDEAQAQRDRAKLAVETGEADVEELKRQSEKYDGLLPKDDCFATLIAKLGRKEGPKTDPSQFEAELESARAKLDRAIREKRYGDALRIVSALAATADSRQQEKLTALLYDIRRIIWEDFQQVIMEGYALENREEYARAKQVYADAAPRFKDTEYHAVLAGRPDDIDLIVRARQPEKKTEIAKKDPPKEQPRRDDPPKEEPKKDEEPVAKVDTSVLHRKLVEAINAGAFKEVKIKLTDSATGEPASADENGVTLKEGAQVAWTDLEPKALFNLYGQLKYEGDEMLVLAEWAHEKGLETEANKTLNRYIAGKKENKAKADAVIARWKGVRVPEGGFAYNAKTGQWEDKGEVANRVAREEAEKFGKELASSTDLKKIDAIVGKLLERYNDQSLKSETREFVKTTALEALKANKKKRVDSVAAKAKAAAGFERVRAAKTELNRRRKEALTVIYDAKIYLPENHPDWRKGDKINGQEEVDKLVAAVRELWEEGGRYVASLDPSVKRDIEGVQEINAKYLREFGEEPGEDDLKDFDEIMNNLNARIDLKNFALNSQERQIWEWNRWVDKYNEQLKDPDVGKEEKEHFKVVNDYREMMGRRRLFLDARLCRATKKHSAAQNAAQQIWHEGSDGSPQSRAQAEGFPGGVGENVAIGYSSPAEIWTRGWYRASDHHRNGLSDAWNCGGYGYVGNVGSENFSNIGAPKKG